MANASARSGPGYIEPDWPAPGTVHAFTTTRSGGVSGGNYASFNLADHVGDAIEDVTRNRRILTDHFSLPSEPVWLSQVHGNTVIDSGANAMHKPEADASWTSKREVVCAVLTADCLPVFFSSSDGSRVAVAHGGWRGLQEGVIAATLAALAVPPQDCMVWLGPAIGPGVFEVGDEVRQAFEQKSAQNAEAFTKKGASHWLCDIYELARIELGQQGVEQVYGGGLCTFEDSERFYSYRRDGDTGRMASLIWISE